MKQLEERARSCLALTEGTMPVTMLVETEEEKQWLLKFLKGKKHSKMIAAVVKTSDGKIS